MSHREKDDLLRQLRKESREAHARGDIKTALDKINQAITLVPSDADAYCARAALLIQQKQLQKAKQDAKYAIKLQPTNWNAYWRLGQVHSMQENWQRAVKTLQRAVELEGDKENEELHSQLEVAKKRAAEFRPQPQRTSDGSIDEGNPLSPDACWGEESVIREMGNLTPPGSHSSSGPLLEARKEGRDAFRSGKYQLALEKVNQAIAIEPTDQDAYSFRSAIYWKLGDINKSLEDAQKCVHLAPEFAIGYLRMGQAYMAMNMLENAVTATRQALNLDSNCMEAAKALQALEGLQKSNSTTGYVMQGILFKKTSMGKWNNRYWCLTEETLTYYHKKGDKKPSGMVPLTTIATITGPNEKHILEISMRGSGKDSNIHFTLKAPSGPEGAKWVQLLRQCVDAANASNPSDAESVALSAKFWKRPSRLRKQKVEARKKKEVIYSGYLKKKRRTGVQNYHRRYFELYEDALVYKKDPHAENAKIVPLIQMETIFGDKKQFVIKVKDEDMYFLTETVQERFNWVDNIRQHMEAQKSGLSIPQNLKRKETTTAQLTTPSATPSKSKPSDTREEEDDGEEEEDEEEEEEEESAPSSSSRKSIISSSSSSSSSSLSSKSKPQTPSTTSSSSKSSTKKKKIQKAKDAPARVVSSMLKGQSTFEEELQKDRETGEVESDSDDYADEEYPGKGMKGSKELSSEEDSDEEDEKKQKPTTKNTVTPGKKIKRPTDMSSSDDENNEEEEDEEEEEEEEIPKQKTLPPPKSPRDKLLSNENGSTNKHDIKLETKRKETTLGAPQPRPSFHNRSRTSVNLAKQVTKVMSPTGLAPAKPHFGKSQTPKGLSSNNTKDNIFPPTSPPKSLPTHFNSRDSDPPPPPPPAPDDDGGALPPPSYAPPPRPNSGTPAREHYTPSRVHAKTVAHTGSMSPPPISKPLFQSGGTGGPIRRSPSNKNNSTRQEDEPPPPPAPASRDSVDLPLPPPPTSPPTDTKRLPNIVPRKSLIDTKCPRNKGQNHQLDADEFCINCAQYCPRVKTFNKQPIRTAKSPDEFRSSRSETVSPPTTNPKKPFSPPPRMSISTNSQSSLSQQPIVSRSTNSSPVLGSSSNPKSNNHNLSLLRRESKSVNNSPKMRNSVIFSSSSHLHSLELDMGNDSGPNSPAGTDKTPLSPQNARAFFLKRESEKDLLAAAGNNNGGSNERGGGTPPQAFVSPKGTVGTTKQKPFSPPPPPSSGSPSSGGSGGKPTSPPPSGAPTTKRVKSPTVRSPPPPPPTYVPDVYNAPVYSLAPVRDKPPKNLY